MAANHNQNGFTLIELLIVVAIIGILAAIAVPQFNKYRINGFNSSAISDLRNLRTVQESLYTEYHRYGATALGNIPGPGLNAGATVIGPGPGVVSTTDSVLGPRGLSIPVGSNVSICATAVPITFTAYNAVAKHQQGDSAYGIDTDSTAIFMFKNFPDAASAIGYSIIPLSDVPLPVTGAIEFTSALGWAPL